MAKYVIVSGGVVSGVGKGVSAASLGLLLRMRGERVTCVKFDPYLNVSASTLSPTQHGECWVCNDGSETDLDLGTYERIVGVEVSAKNICTSGMLYTQTIQGERDGKFLGETIQVIPHLTNRIQEILVGLGDDADIVIVEIGGTVGDWESGHFYEAVRQFRKRCGPDNVVLVHVAPILWLNTIGEFKTKPLQKSVMELRQFGLEADIILCRVDRPVSEKLLDKVSQLTGVERQMVVEAIDTTSIYQVPIVFYDKHVDDLVADKLKLRRTGVRIHKYRELVEKYVNAENLPVVTVGIIGKYTNCQDAYLSLKEAIYHAGVANNSRVEIRWIDAEDLEEYQTLRGLAKFFDGIQALIVPGGFDNRGIEGKIKGIQYARERKIPFLGICLGLQCAVIEFARNQLGIADASSVEFKADCEPVIHFVPGMEHVRKKGGTLRLGAFDCQLAKDSLAGRIYQKKTISERHRHRYEVNSEYRDRLENGGFMVSGVNPDTGLIEVMEMDRKQHPFFIAGQFHPEFKSRLGYPHPLFDELLHFATEGRLRSEALKEAECDLSIS